MNLENLDDAPGVEPPFEERIRVLRPQLERLEADILCLQEVNAQKVSKDQPRRFRALDRLLEGTDYATFHRAVSFPPQMTSPGDKQNLVILSRFPIGETHLYRNDLLSPPEYRSVTSRPPQEAAAPASWDRPVLHAVIDLPGGRPLHVLNLHLRAPLAAFIEGQKLEPFTWKSAAGWAEGYYLAAMKRAGQALEARLAVERIFDADEAALVLVCGDFNAEAAEVPTRILEAREEDTGNGALAGRVLVALERSIPADRRYTVLHHGRPQMLDHFLVSRELLARYRGMEIHNEDLGDELVAYRDIRHPPDSYHAPLVASFDFSG